MTSDLLAEIDKRLTVCREAAPGPWSVSWLYGALRHINRNVDFDAFWSTDPDEDRDKAIWPEKTDAAFIAASSTQRAGELEALKLAVSVINTMMDNCACNVANRAPCAICIRGKDALDSIAARLEGKP
jgi:hypothetical protein